MIEDSVGICVNATTLATSSAITECSLLVPSSSEHHEYQVDRSDVCDAQLWREAGLDPVKCYADKQELVDDADWCRPPAENPPPKGLWGLWFMHGVDLREVAFCGSLARWDPVREEALVDYAHAFVFEDSLAGKSLGLAMSESGAFLRLTPTSGGSEWSITGQGAGDVAATPAMRALVNGPWNSLAFARTEDLNVYTRVSEGIGASPSYALKRLYTYDDNGAVEFVEKNLDEFSGAFDQSVGYSWVGDELKSKFWRFADVAATRLESETV